MKNYRQYSVEELITDAEFVKWVISNDQAGDVFWNNWLQSNPDKKEVVEEARLLLLSLKTEERQAGKDELDQQVSRLLNTIHQLPEQQTNARVFGMKRWMAAAASLIIIVGASMAYTLYKRSNADQYSYASVVASADDLIEKVNSGTTATTVTLPDNSTVKLSAGSRVSFSKTFNNNATRDIYLSGEAFFTVTKNPARPFRVFANEIVTKVLGTSFIVRSVEGDKNIRVIVKTGKVSVYSRQKADKNELAAPRQLGGILLTPNQQLVYSVDNKNFEKKLVDQPEIVKDKEEKENTKAFLIYNDSPVVAVFEAMEKIYRIPLVYDSSRLANCTITADCSNETFYSQLDLICSAINAKYDVKDGVVTITAPGCK